MDSRSEQFQAASTRLEACTANDAAKGIESAHDAAQSNEIPPPLGCLPESAEELPSLVPPPMCRHCHFYPVSPRIPEYCTWDCRDADGE
jgi:hypothetical protein